MLRFHCYKNSKGFTLIELMVVVAILAIVAVIAVPSFLDQVRKARMSDAKQTLMDVAAKLEQYYQDNKGYPTTADMTLLGYTSNPFVSPEKYYTISFVGSPTTTSYTIQAQPTEFINGEKNDQYKERKCHTFVYNNLGEKKNKNQGGTEPVSYTHLTLPTTDVGCCCGWWAGD